MDPATLTPVQPTWLPPSYSDQRMAWNATYPDLPRVPLRIEAAAYRGKPVYLRVVRPWTPPERSEPAQKPVAKRAQEALNLALNLMLLAAASWHGAT